MSSLSRCATSGTATQRGCYTVRKLVTVIVALFVSLVIWSLYLVPVAAGLDVGYGNMGFRKYGTYTAVLVREFRSIGSAVDGKQRYGVKVAAVLPADASAMLQTTAGQLYPTGSRIESENEETREWVFDVPVGDIPQMLVVEVGNEVFHWELTNYPKFVSFPWWYRIAPPWAKKSHMHRVGLAKS